MKSGADEESPRETDAELRARLINEYGGWGALASLICESSGRSLDDIAERHFGMTRR